MLNWIFRCRNNSSIQKEFDYILDFAQDLAGRNPTALIDLVRILLRPLQAELLLTAVKNEIHRTRQPIQEYTFFMPDGPRRIQMVFDYPQLDSDKFLVQLNRDPILPCPWHRDRYVDTLANIGHGKSWGNWVEDVINHSVMIWLPWGIPFVDGGNHSIATGIITGEGTLKPKYVCDMGKLLDLVNCDGKHYRSSQNNKVLDIVRDAKIAALFEIGRLMRKHNIVPMAITNTCKASD